MVQYIRKGLLKVDYLVRLGTKKGYKAQYEALAAAVENAPVEEGKLVKYGQWVGENKDECNQCHERTRWFFDSHCPNCGAKMDG